MKCATQMMCLTAIVAALGSVASADSFGTGVNAFTIDFVTISGDASSANGMETPHPRATDARSRGIKFPISEHSRVLFLRSQMPFHCRALLNVWNYIHQPTVFFRRRVLDELSFNIRLHYIMDYEFWLRAAGRYKFRPVGGLVAASRWHGDCKTVNDPAAFFTELDSVHAELGRPLLAGIVPSRVTARLLYRLQRLYSLAFLGCLRRDKPFKHITIGPIVSLLRRQVLGIRVGGNGAPSQEGRATS